jgi:hypothetical protein
VRRRLQLADIINCTWRRRPDKGGGVMPADADDEPDRAEQAARGCMVCNGGLRTVDPVHIRPALPGAGCATRKVWRQSATKSLDMAERAASIGVAPGDSRVGRGRPGTLNGSDTRLDPR